MSKLTRSLFGVLLATTLFASLVMGGVLLVVRETSKLPNHETIAFKLTTKLQSASSGVYDKGGNRLGTLSPEQKIWIPYEQIPKHVVRAFVSAEDKNFWKHPGVDPVAVARAAIANIKRARTTQGGSTITQQVARLLFLDRSQNYSRKFREVILAFAIEKKLSKKQILEIYLNNIFFGQGAWGIEAAARTYFGKAVDELNMGEAALLAGLPKAPSRLALHRNLPKALERRKFVLARMVEDGILSRKDAARWESSKVKLAPQRKEISPVESGWFLAEVRRELAQRWESQGLDALGYKVHTTLDAEAQKSAARATSRTLAKLRNKTLRNGPIEAALVAINPRNGDILALQGGGDFRRTQYNRAILTRRAIGQLTAPLFVTMMLEQGYQLTTPIGANFEVPLTLMDILDETSPEHTGALSALMAEAGVGTFMEFQKKLGLDLEKRGPELAAGEATATPLTLARAFASMAAKGRVPRTRLIRGLEGAPQKVFQQSAGTRAMSEDTAWIIRDVMTSRSGWDSGFAAASPDLHNSWFVGFTADIVAVAWIGSEFGDAKLAPSDTAARKLAEGLWQDFRAGLPKELRRPLDAVPPPQSVAWGLSPNWGALPQRVGTSAGL